MAKIIDGKAIASEIRRDLKRRADDLKQQGIVPGLAVILLGAHPPSAIYVRNKIRACEEVGIASFKFELPSQTDQKEVLAIIKELNQRADVDGILVQLPLPPQFAIAEVLRTISADKDVDGFHLYN